MVRFVIPTLVAMLGLAVPVAHARRGGIAAAGCSGCHGGGTNTVPTLTVSPVSFAPGATVTLTLSIPTANGGTGGFFLRSANRRGAFSLVSGEPTQLNGAYEVTHTAPKASSGGVVTFQIRWTAPATPSGVDFEFWTVASNNNNGSSGDGTGEGRVNFVYGCTGNTYYRDFDADGFGSMLSGITKDCTTPEGYAAVDGDCDENDPQRYPGATEVCNGHDDDCDGLTDENLPLKTFYTDNDRDGFAVAGTASVQGCVPPPGYAESVGDCDDNVATTYPGATERCNNVDDDCDSRVDEGARATCGVGMCARYAPSCSLSLCKPGSPVKETCNLLDDDCDGVIDNGSGEALCGAGKYCDTGNCVTGEDPGRSPAGSTDNPSGSQKDGGSSPRSGCAQSPAELMLWMLVLLTQTVRKRRTGSASRSRFYDVASDRTRRLR